MGHRLGVDAKAFLDMMAGLVIPTQADNARLLGGTSPAILEPAWRFTEVMQKERMLSSQADIESAIDPGFQQCH